MIFLARAAHELRFARKPGEDFPEQIAGVVFVAGEIKEEGEQRLGVFIINSLNVGVIRHHVCINDALRRRICLQK